MHAWFASPAGRYLLDWEQACLASAFDGIFGYHGVQLGLGALDGLAASRVRRNWLAAGSYDLPWPIDGIAARSPVLVTDFTALPFASGSMDMVLMPHTLDLAADPHAALREAERVLVPDGKLLIFGLNPTSFWGVHQRRSQLLRGVGLGSEFLPDAMQGIGYRRLRDWLRLLSFEVESSQFGCFRPAVRSQRWLDRFGWLDSVGARWWPIFGAAHFLMATKRVAGMRLIAPAWKIRQPRKEAAGVPVAGRDNVARRGPAPVPEPRPSSFPDS
ncbi:methyltransferase domain-containing protein [Xylophilus rhododendri]|uniref:Methyltransferase domain-containing protein n=1 Tax=Xylophilus rhododendri TaxID=2697032 RepID=A0A857JE43_9BURK|nr:methyltransferase domain-containing protein [Xylophilus rhododendri]